MHQAMRATSQDGNREHNLASTLCVLSPRMQRLIAKPHVTAARMVAKAIHRQP